MANDSQLRGFARILTTEVHVSNLLQELTDLDERPWQGVIGVLPTSCSRERSLAKLRAKRRVKGAADLVLESASGDEVAAIEVKVAHTFSKDQRLRYEEATDGPLFLLGMDSDRTLVDHHERWRFHALADVFDAWTASSDPIARALARRATDVLRSWDRGVDAVFHPAEGAQKLASLHEKFLATLVSRRIEHDLEVLGRLAWAGHSKGGSGLAQVQAFAPLNDDENRCLTAEVRWEDGLKSAAFRFGVDFYLDETAAARAEAWALAKSMDAAIRIDPFNDHLVSARPDLAGLVTVGRRDHRGAPDDDLWLPVVERGLMTPSNPNGVPSPRGRRATRSSMNPGFVGDRTQRFEASGRLDLSQVDATDVRDLIDEGLKHLCAHLPDGYSCSEETTPRPSSLRQPASGASGLAFPGRRPGLA
jgi:hypothetical protein